MDIDRTSFQLGMINCFAEMVAVGVKCLAISPPLDPEEYEGIREASEAIVLVIGEANTAVSANIFTKKLFIVHP